MINDHSLCFDVQVGYTADEGNTKIEGSFTISRSDGTTHTCHFTFHSHEVGDFHVSPSSGNITGYNPGSSTAGKPNANTLSYIIMLTSSGRPNEC